MLEDFFPLRLVECTMFVFSEYVHISIYNIDVNCIAFFTLKSNSLKDGGWFHTTNRWIFYLPNCWIRKKSIATTHRNELSNEKNPGCLGYIGDYTTQLYRDYNKPL